MLVPYQHPVTEMHMTAMCRGNEILRLFRKWTAPKDSITRVTCPECSHVFDLTEGYSYCLVAHQDGSACISCPKCPTYIPTILYWHHKEFDIETGEEIEEPEPEIYKWKIVKAGLAVEIKGDNIMTTTPTNKPNKEEKIATPEYARNRLKDHMLPWLKDFKEEVKKVAAESRGETYTPEVEEE